ncbi:MAG: polysaccharide deacetylase family protein [Coriobacteriia bacterium]
MAPQVTVVASPGSLAGLLTVLQAEGFAVAVDGDVGGSAPRVAMKDAAVLLTADAAVAAEASALVVVLDEGGRLAQLASDRGVCDVTGRLSADFAEIRWADRSRAGATLREYGLDPARVPIRGIAVCEPRRDAEVLAVFETEGAVLPASIRSGSTVVVAFDAGRSMADLLSEAYAQRDSGAIPLPGFLAAAYRHAPWRLRLLAYSRLLRSLRRDVEASARFSTKSPIEPSGFSLQSLVVEALDSVSGTVPRVWRWPSAAGSAVCLTHDIEPRRFAFEKGLPRLLDELRAAGVRSSVDVVADPGFPLPRETLRRAAGDGHEIVSHGLRHDASFFGIAPDQRAVEVRVSVDRLRSTVGAPVRGFRAPWLMRTPDLPAALEEAGLAYGSSTVDADTSLKAGWHGTGVGYLLPFHPFGLVGRHGILELPVCGPQDMEPVFAGLSVGEAEDVFARKIGWVRDTASLGVMLVHAGVYGRDDLETRMRLLRRVILETSGEDVWRVPMGEVASWWIAREEVLAVPARNGGPVRVVNRGATGIDGVTLAWPDDAAPESVAVGGVGLPLVRRAGRVLAVLPVLPPGSSTEVICG